LQLLSERYDVAIHRAGGGKRRHAPGAVEELIAGDDGAGAFEKELQRGEFLPGQSHFAPGLPHTTSGEINPQIAEHENSRCLLGIDGIATQQRANPGEEFVAAERFHEVIIRAEVESADTILDTTTRGENENA